MSVAFAKEVVSATEFDDWALYFEQRFEMHEKEDYLAALVATAALNANGANAKLESQLLKFSPKVTHKESLSPETSQSIWLSALGIKKE